MNLFLPKNIYTTLIAKHLPEDLRKNIRFLPSALITQQISDNKDSAGLIPILDLVNHNELFVSRHSGLAFEGELGNAWLYFNDKEKKINDLYLLGDVSSTEVILSKILFKETYNTDVEIHLASDENITDKNLLLIGDINYKNDMYTKGISFTEEVMELITLPYVNFIYASQDKDIINELNEALNGVSNKIYDRIEEKQYETELSDECMEYISRNVSDIVFDFNEHDSEGIDQLLRLPFFYGIAPEMLEIKFV
jgi:hypothetical protein